MIKIGIECESIEQDSWGIARIVSKTLEELARRPQLAADFKFYLYFKSRIPDYPYLDNPLFVKRLVRVPFLPVSFSLYSYVFLPIRALFDRLNVMYFPNYMLPLIFVGKSLVLSVHDAYYEARNKNIPFRYRLAYRIFATWAAWRATGLMALSEFGKREVAAVYRIRPERIVVNHLGIEAPVLADPSRPSDRAYLLFVGQAFPRRHLKETLLTFEEIAPEFPELDFVIVGKDKYSPPVISGLARRINETLGTERIRLREQVSEAELRNLMMHAQAVTYISDKEAFGLPPLEALAHGAVPVVADVPVSREIFGDAAFFVQAPFSPDKIARTLRNALHHHTERERIMNARQRFLKTFSWSAHVDRLLEALKTIAHA